MSSLSPWSSVFFSSHVYMTLLTTKCWTIFLLYLYFKLMWRTCSFCICFRLSHVLEVWNQCVLWYFVMLHVWLCVWCCDASCVVVCVWCRDATCVVVCVWYCYATWGSWECSGLLFLITTLSTDPKAVHIPLIPHGYLSLSPFSITLAYTSTHRLAVDQRCGRVRVSGSLGGERIQETEHLGR